MTTYKSAAVNAGLMPDKTLPGLVLCRTGTYTTTDDSLVSGDTIEMVPIPAGAKILDVQLYCSGNAALASGVHVGDGQDTNRYFGVGGLPTFTGDHVVSMTYNVSSGVNPAGFNKDYATDDTIDIKLQSIATKVPTSVTFTLNVFYKMAGSLDDEDS